MRSLCQNKRSSKDIRSFTSCEICEKFKIVAKYTIFQELSFSQRSRSPEKYDRETSKNYWMTLLKDHGSNNDIPFKWIVCFEKIEQLDSNFFIKILLLNWKRSWITATKSMATLTVLSWTENMFAWNIVTNKWFINVTTCYWKIRLLKKPTFFSVCSFCRWFLIFIFLVIH